METERNSEGKFISGHKSFMSKEVKEKIRNNAKNNPNFGMRGKKHSEKTKKHWSIIRKGVKPTKATRKKLSEAKIGAKCYLWKGGISFEPYPIDWTESFRENIRERDNYVCQLCGIHQDELGRKLDVHHIDYNKNNLDTENLISLCRICHLKTNFNRDYWEDYLLDFMRDNIKSKSRLKT